MRLNDLRSRMQSGKSMRSIEARHRFSPSFATIVDDDLAHYRWRRVRYLSHKNSMKAREKSLRIFVWVRCSNSGVHADTEERLDGIGLEEQSIINTELQWLELSTTLFPFPVSDAFLLSTSSRI